jgi:hypothetical protein
MSYADFLRGLLSEETCAREENQMKRRMRQAYFPFEKGKIKYLDSNATENAAETEIETVDSQIK